MGISIADEKIKDHPREKGFLICGGAGTLFFQQSKATRQRWPSLTFIFLVRKDAKRLTKIFLVQSQNFAVFLPLTVKAFDDIKPVSPGGKGTPLNNSIFHGISS